MIADILKAAIERRIDWVQLGQDQQAEDHDRMLISGLLPAPNDGEDS